ncbi:hypothetical protein F8154_01920 [Alkaliphilus pronyensis]|uniref:Uncharacterized protein n=2 Tax=Alkaliphilus pronyensis TaxID=1482732 RepID=A0A6I0F5M0_9FIRM|nr:hypothetical protein F8154_01920 [Alkaliphilus pronyensis]
MNILDFLKEKEELVIQKYVGEFDLKDFLSKSIQRLGHVQAIVVDRICLINTEEIIIDAIRAFKSLSKIKIVFYIPNEEQSLVHELIGLGIFNIITESEVDKLKKEIEMCLLEDMTEKYIKDKFDLVHDIKEGTLIDFKGKQITIGVVGAQHRVGTTTVTMQFACYLSSIGAKVSYVEANDSGHMKLIAEHYEMEKNGDGYLYKGVAFEPLNSKNETEFECIVYDLGVFSKKALVALENVQIPIVCGGDKAFEQNYMEVINKEIVNHYFKIINFSEDIKDGYYLKFEPCLFRFRTNKDIFEDIFTHIQSHNKIIVSH